MVLAGLQQGRGLLMANCTARPRAAGSALPALAACPQLLQPAVLLPLHYSGLAAPCTKMEISPA